MKKFFIICLFYSLNVYSFFDERELIWFPSHISLSAEGHVLEEIDGGFAVPLIDVRGTNITGYAFNDSLSVGPVVGGDLTLGSKTIISLSGSAVLGENGELLLEKGDKGYVVIEKSNFYLTLGPDFGQSLGSSLGVSIGLAGSFGKEVLTQRYVPNKDLLKKKFIPKIPTNNKMLSSMSIGDSYIYTTQGGVVINSSVGAFSTGVSAGLSVQGIWKVEIQKSGISKATAVISRFRITNVKGSAGVPLTEISISRIKKSIKNYIYEFDLSSLKGEKLFKEFLKGNIKKVQDSIASNPDLKKIVLPLVDTKGFFFSKQLKSAISAPQILSLGVTGDKIRGFLTSKYLDKDNVVNSHIGIYKRNSFLNTKLMKILSKIKKATVGNFDTTKIFMGHVKNFVSLGGNKVEIKDTWGANLRVQITGNSFTKKGFKYAARKMTTWTGFEDTFLPLKSPKDRLGYIELTLDASFSNKAIEELVYYAEKASEDVFINYALVAVNNYARNTSDPFNYCAGKVERGKFPRTCKGRISALTKTYMKMAYRSLLKLRKLLEDKNYKQASKELANLGKGMTHNHFTLKTLWWMMRNKPIEAKITIQGEDIQKYEKSLKTFAGGKKTNINSFLKNNVQNIWD